MKKCLQEWFGLILGSVIPRSFFSQRDTLRPAVVDRRPNTSSGFASGKIAERAGRART
jgi:hypothetical protein